MNKNIEDWKKAGQLAAEALNYGKELIKKDAKIIDVVEKIEKKINEKAEPAFPINISMNETAAHDTAFPDDKRILEGVVKLDIGVCVNGAIGDTAATIDLTGKNSELVKASEKALENAIKLVKIDAKVSDIGKEIEQTIKSFGFKPVKNLSGHEMDYYKLHAGITIPNFEYGNEKLKEGQVIAIEPFATNGAGLIIEKGAGEIFMMTGIKPVRSMITREIIKELIKFNGLPFSKRNLIQKFSLPKVNFAFKELDNLGLLREYSPLIEKANGLVSQAEHTILVSEKPLVLTKLD